MKHRRRFLRVHRKAMAAEMRIIKLEESRTRRWKLGPTFTGKIPNEVMDRVMPVVGISGVHLSRKKIWLTDRDTESLSALRTHRKKLSYEARHAHLAHAFFRGHSYLDTENIVRPDSHPNLDRVQYYVQRFGVDKNDGEAWEEQKGALDAWIARAEANLKLNNDYYIANHEFKARDRRAAYHERYPTPA